MSRAEPVVHVEHHSIFVRYRAAGLEGPLPTLLHVPGFGEDALSHAPFAVRMARAGFELLAMQPPWAETPEFIGPSPAALFELLARGDTPLAAMRARAAEAPWLALTGFSMGGMFVSHHLVEPGRIALDAAAIVLSSGDWSFLPRTTLDAFPELRASLPPEALAAVEAQLRAESPVARAERFPPLPLLLINADNDPRVPLATARAFTATLGEAYDAAGAGEALTFDVHQGNRHEFRRAMQRRLRAWLMARWQAACGGGKGANSDCDA